MATVLCWVRRYVCFFEFQIWAFIILGLVCQRHIWSNFDLKLWLLSK
jgi:hypothetical protein